MTEESKPTYKQRSKTVAIDFEPSTLKSFRGVLFSKGIKLRQFINYVAELANVNDEIVLELMDSCKSSMVEEKADKDFSKLSAEELYDLIENDDFQMESLE